MFDGHLGVYPEIEFTGKLHVDPVENDRSDIREVRAGSIFVNLTAGETRPAEASCRFGYSLAAGQMKFVTKS
jgi:hypothetical protein